jgi:hypothetical protein
VKQGGIDARRGVLFGEMPVGSILWPAWHRTVDIPIDVVNNLPPPELLALNEIS